MRAPGTILGALLLSTMLLTVLLRPCPAAAREKVSMYVGEVRVLQIGSIERVAIGNPKVASNTILPQGQLVLLAESQGVTTMHIWLQDETEKEFDIVVREKQAVDSHQELVRLLGDINGVLVEKIGDLTVVKGNISLGDQELFERILARYDNVLNLVTVRDTVADVSTLLAEVPGITVRDIGGNSVITGEVSKEYAGLINIIEQKYPNILNMTRVHEAVAGKMIYMQVRIMEVKRNVTENLGINWTILKGIQGPSFAFGVETNRNNATILNSSQQDIPQSLNKSGRVDLTSGTGYFGIATGINSILNLYESTGDVVTLAEPRLSTRSGGSAEFLAGGEFPVPVTNSLGFTDVEFKKYGISLNIQPMVDDDNNIVAHIETELSSIETNLAVNGIPSVATRRTSTDVSLRAEETLVIAGLVSGNGSKNYNNVKWLSEIPVLGALFKSKEFNNLQSELVIFITPTVYDAQSPINASILAKGKEIEERFEKITEGKSLLD